MSLMKYMMALNQAKAYTDSQRLAYEEIQETVILPELSRTVRTNGERTSAITRELVIGETYIVKYDGVEYECKAHLDEEFNYFLILGNDAFLGSDTPGGLPFCVATTSEVWVYDDGKEHTISVYQRKEVVHPIDPKYIPGAVLPVVEITTIPTEAGAILTEAESARMEEVLTEGVSIMLKLYFEEDLPGCCLLDLLNSSEAPQFLNFNMGVGIAKRITGDWVVQLIGG